MTREEAEIQFKKEPNLGEINNTVGGIPVEKPFLYIADWYYRLMQDKGELRTKEEVESDWIKQHLSGGKFDAKILVY